MSTPTTPGTKVTLTDEELVARAAGARARAYAPYSRYEVGSALIADGEVFAGANIENGSYGLTICAERTAIAHAVFAGKRELERVAVVTESSPPAAPCGMCLQTLIEFASEPKNVKVILANVRGERRVFTLSDLAPHAFRPADLDRKG
jgi:cytidine deaminase